MSSNETTANGTVGGCGCKGPGAPSTALVEVSDEGIVGAAAAVNPGPGHPGGGGSGGMGPGGGFSPGFGFNPGFGFGNFRPFFRRRYFQPNFPVVIVRPQQPQGQVVYLSPGANRIVATGNGIQVVDGGTRQYVGEYFLLMRGTPTGSTYVQQIPVGWTAATLSSGIAVSASPAALNLSGSGTWIRATSFGIQVQGLPGVYSAITIQGFAGPIVPLNQAYYGPINSVYSYSGYSPIGVLGPSGTVGDCGCQNNPETKYLADGEVGCGCEKCRAHARDLASVAATEMSMAHSGVTMGPDGVLGACCNECRDRFLKNIVLANLNQGITNQVGFDVGVGAPGDYEVVNGVQQFTASAATEALAELTQAGFAALSGSSAALQVYQVSPDLLASSPSTAAVLVNTMPAGWTALVNGPASDAAFAAGGANPNASISSLLVLTNDANWIAQNAGSGGDYAVLSPRAASSSSQAGIVPTTTTNYAVPLLIGLGVLGIAGIWYATKKPVGHRHST